MDREVVPVPTPRGLIRFEDRLAADIRIASLPPGKDPDEVIRENPAGWAQLIAGAKPIMDYYFQTLTKDLDLTSGQDKGEAVRRLGPLVAEVGDRVQRTHYVQQLARMVRMDERDLWQQIKETTGAKQPRHRSRHKAPPEEPKTQPLSLDAHCLSFILYYPQLLPVIDAMLLKSQEEGLRGEDLSRPEDQAILNAWRRWLSEGGTPDARAGFYDTLDDQLQYRVDSLIEAREQEPDAPDDLVHDKVMDAITRLRLQNLRRETEQMRFLLLDARSSMDDEGASTYSARIRETGARFHRLYQAMADRSVTHRRRDDHGIGRIPYSEE
jgi:DNA primase